MDLLICANESRGPWLYFTRLSDVWRVWHCADCVDGELCVYTELRSVWAARCIDVYRFNVQQKTLNRCQSVELISSQLIVDFCPSENTRPRGCIVKRCSHCARHRTTPDDSTTSYDVVRCRAQCEHRLICENRKVTWRRFADQFLQLFCCYCQLSIKYIQYFVDRVSQKLFIGRVNVQTIIKSCFFERLIELNL